MSKPLIWVGGEIQTPPFSFRCRQEIGGLLRDVQDGYGIKQPSGRPMPSIGNRVHELRVDDRNVSWRVVYRIDDDAIVIFDVFAKKRQQTPRQAIKRIQRRIKRYDSS